MSDSEPSGDNLDDDEILKLIPKKLNKKKYLKGLEEKEKTVKKPKKKKDDKPKTELMPCLQSKAKELAAKRKEEKEAEKDPKPVTKATVKRAITISKPLLHTKKNGLSVRDVAT